MTSKPEHDPPKCGVVSPSSVTRSGPGRNLHCWSQIPSDLMRLVFERLGFADFKRAKSVCSSWESDSRQSEPNNQIPWLILFPQEENYCLLLNPEEKEKLYKTQDLGNDFAESFCVATYRSWLLMQYREDDVFILYILDVLARERITLPTSKSDWIFRYPVFWIDEKTRDRLVIIREHGEVNAVSFKKGDDSWRIIPELSGIERCLNMVYTDHKLYSLNYNELKIFDFYGDIPALVFKVNVSGCIQRPRRRRPYFLGVPGIPWADRKFNVVVTICGDILIVKSTRPALSKIWEFEIYEMDLSMDKEWRKIVSLGDETILLDLGITVLATNLEGIKSNSIYFNGKGYHREFDGNAIFIYSLDTKSVEQPPQFVSSSIPFSNARWFLPSFKRQ